MSSRELEWGGSEQQLQLQQQEQEQQEKHDFNAKLRLSNLRLSNKLRFV